MRPVTFDELLGQERFTSPGKPFRKLIDTGKVPSVIFWGPPGSGKTTMARLIASSQKSVFLELSAVTAGVADLRKAIDLARAEWKSTRRRTVLFIDEIHRFSKVQQDAILPRVEDGTVIIIGSTTENPSFEVIPALRSRCRIFRLEALGFDNVLRLLERAVSDKERGLGECEIKPDKGVLERIAGISGGDARVALNLLEAAAHASDKSEDGRRIGMDNINELAKDSSILYDKLGQEHFDHASAFQKSLRGSDPDAAIYWLAKMLAGGEDPRFIARRLIITASEDVGLADPAALMVAVAAAEAVERTGLPEGRIPLAHATLHIATAPKSNSAYVAIKKAMNDIENQGESLSVPDHLKDTHYKDAKKFGFGKGYKYPHDYPGHFIEQGYLPEKLLGRKYYEPTNLGRETGIADRMRELRKGRRK